MSERIMTREERSRALRYKRPALESLGYDSIMSELEKICEDCDEVSYCLDSDIGALIDALDGAEDEAYEFRMMFSDLSGKAEQLGEAMYDFDSREDFDDCTVALIGNRYDLVGFDSYEEDYYSLTRYDSERAYSEAGKRLMRRTKSEMISLIGQSLGTLLAFLDLRQSYDYLKATMDVLKDGNASILKTIREIERVYDRANDAGFVPWDKATRELDRLLSSLPGRVWVEG